MTEAVYDVYISTFTSYDSMRKMGETKWGKRQEQKT